MGLRQESDLYGRKGTRRQLGREERHRGGEARGVSKERSGESLCYSGALSREKDSVKEAVSARTSC